jgi:hypothetical protein
MYQMSPVEGAPEDFDQTIFVIQKNRSIGPVEEIALNFIKDQHRYSSILIETLCEFSFREFCCVFLYIRFLLFFGCAD